MVQGSSLRRASLDKWEDKPVMELCRNWEAILLLWKLEPKLAMDIYRDPTFRPVIQRTVLRTRSTVGISKVKTA